MTMSGKKIISLISGICGLIIGIVMIIAAIMDAVVPKPLWIAFSAACLTNAVMILTNTKNKN